ncbi:MAG TPA: tetratricopeptide repeat protein [Chitinophagaceae bacterium]
MHAALKYVKEILFFSLLGVMPIGLFLKLKEVRASSELTLLGMLGAIGFFLFWTYKGLFNKPLSLKNLLLYVLIILTIITVFSKYFYHRFWDIPALIIVPAFIFYTIFLFLKKEIRDKKLVVTCIMLSILLIPLFINLNLLKEPGKYIPSYWNPEYDVIKYVNVKDPSEVNLPETKTFLKKAFLFDKSQKYDSAIYFYKAARALEPNNTTILFYMSNSYAQLDNLSEAISLLDTAISIQNSFPAFFNNRGLYYYKLNQNDKAIENYHHAIDLDSTQPVFYCNLALVQYYQNDLDKACDAIKKLDELKFDYSDQSEIIQIKTKHCK